MSNVPLAREQLLALAETLPPRKRREVQRIVRDLLVREAPVKKARNKSQPLTPLLARSIRNFYRNNSGLHNSEIAAKFNVNPGRVSEALNNKV